VTIENRSRSTRERLARSLVIPFSVLVVWQIVAGFHLVSSTLLPQVPDTAARLWHFLSTRDLLPDLEWSIVRILAGFLSAAFVGVALGLVIGLDERLLEVMVAPIDFVRSIPISILYPVFVLVFGISHLSKIAMVFFGCVFVIALNTSHGVINAKPVRRQMASLWGASRAQVTRYITFYESLPQTAVGLRIALSFAVVVEVLCEMFMGSEHGLGQRVSDAYTTYAIPDLYALILIVGSLGFLLNRLLARLERTVVFWERA